MKLVTKDQRIKEAVHLANLYFQSEEFKKDILTVNEYSNSNASPEKILHLFETFAKIRSVEVVCTYFGIFWRKVLGKTIGNGKAYVNSLGLNRPLWQVAATVVHEVSHVVDEYFPEYEFGHGSNSPNGKSMTFPYFIDEKAERWIKREVLKKEVQRITREIESSYFATGNIALFV